jgi:hypothetical protein
MSMSTIPIRTIATSTRRALARGALEIMVAAAVLFAIPAVASAEVDDAQVSARLADMNAEMNARSAEFSRSAERRLAALDLDSLMTPENLATAQGRTRIRNAYAQFSAILDEIDAFTRSEDARRENALAAVVRGLPAQQSQEVAAAFKKGSARSGVLYDDLYRLQRESIRASLELVDLLELGARQVQLADGRLAFADEQMRAKVKTLIDRLASLEQAQSRAEQRIVESREESKRRLRPRDSSHGIELETRTTKMTGQYPTALQSAVRDEVARSQVKLGHSCRAIEGSPPAYRAPGNKAMKVE